MTKGKYTRDFYFIPTILYHNGDGIYASRIDDLIDNLLSESEGK